MLQTPTRSRSGAMAAEFAPRGERDLAAGTPGLSASACAPRSLKLMMSETQFAGSGQRADTLRVVREIATADGRCHLFCYTTCARVTPHWWHALPARSVHAHRARQSVLGQRPESRRSAHCSYASGGRTTRSAERRHSFCTVSGLGPSVSQPRSPAAGPARRGSTSPDAKAPVHTMGTLPAPDRHAASILSSLSQTATGLARRAWAQRGPFFDRHHQRF